MIKINDSVVQTGRFPDGTPVLKVSNMGKAAVITWLYDGDDELPTIYYIARHLQSQNTMVDLFMPYIPNARMDRVKEGYEVFTLKYFAEVINSLGFNRVIVFDPHSNVSTALLDRVVVIQPTDYISLALSSVGAFHKSSIIMVYPDEGAMKRYSSLLRIPYAFGVKNRDWNSGSILSLDIIGNVKDYETALICDDICSKGGTFLHTAKALRNQGVKNVYLYISHCENAILDGELINSGLVDRIYTTNSIFRRNHPLITVYDVEGAKYEH